MPGSTGFRPGVQRKDDKLVLWTRGGVTVIRIWDQPAGWVKTADRPYWRHCRPEIDFAMHALVQKERRAAAEFRKFEAGNSDHARLWPGHATPWPVYNLQRAQRAVHLHREFYGLVPEPVRRAIAPFRSRQFSLLSFCARCPGGMDLLHSTPALALMLANAWVFAPKVCQPLRSVRALLRKRQRCQMEWLRFAAPSEAAVRILRKVPAPQCSMPLLLYLRTAMADPGTIRLLSHLERVNRGVVRIVSDPNLLPMAGPALLEEVSRMKSEDDTSNTAYALKDLLERHRAGNTRPGILQSTHQLHQRLGRVFRDEARTGGEDFEELVFPPPPVEGTSEITPLCSLDELQEEGDRQQHCIGGYGSQIAREMAFAYRVTHAGERSTALIRPVWRQGRKVWVLDDCKGRKNASVTDGTMKLLNAWLAARQGIEVDDTGDVELFFEMDDDIPEHEEPEINCDVQMMFEEFDDVPF